LSDPAVGCKETGVLGCDDGWEFEDCDIGGPDIVEEEEEEEEQEEEEEGASEDEGEGDKHGEDDKAGEHEYIPTKIRFTANTAASLVSALRSAPT